ncbi:glutathione S-transferase family protein [Caldimonas sp. KR1-144]|uniref:glutathione S-transferase family protein n=1 Tax=Caldimonas sp. KR1-144 TaxID=3400911 RepID=UPI003C07EE7E
MKLVIGNKNYSSWSMRPWVLMRQAGIPFEELKLSFAHGLDTDGPFKRELARYSGAGRVPVLLLDNGHAVWDTLAIAETLAELFAHKQLWPADPRSRALARSACAEMHSGFVDLRTHFPMNIEASLPEVGPRVMAENAGVRADVARLVSLWGELLVRSGGPLLFGTFTIADAYFAPVCMRVRTYGIALPPALEAYVDRVLALPGVAAWRADALAENEFVEFDEPYRTR